MPAAGYSAREIAWHTRKQPVVAVCRVVPVAAKMPVFFTAGAYRRCKGPINATISCECMKGSRKDNSLAKSDDTRCSCVSFCANLEKISGVLE